MRISSIAYYLRYIFVALSTFIIISCTVTDKKKQWTPVEKMDQIVWADDDSEVAMVILHFEESQPDWLDTTTEKRYFKHQLFRQKINSEERTALTELRDHRLGHVFFMKSANYLITESILPGGARRFDKIDMQGHEILIVETPDEAHRPCQSATQKFTLTPTVLPAPDGQQLAYVYSPECNKATIEFLEIEHLTVLDNQTFNIDEPMHVTWHRDGYVIFSTVQRDKAWQVKVQEPPLPILPPRCLSPVTTSSSVSAEGHLIYLNEDTKKLVTREVGRKQAFGCQ